MRRISLLVLAVLFACSIAARAQTPDPFSHLAWRSMGPAVSGGRLGAVAGTDRNPALYYVGAAGGGVWKTTNAGTSWTPVFDREDVASIGAVAIDPQNDDAVWVGTGEGNPRNDVTQGDGVYRTTDGGKHWSHVLPLRNALISAIVVDPRDSKGVVVAVLGDPFADNADRGIYRTADGGTTWSKVLYLGPSSGASDLVADPSDPYTLYAGMWQYRRTGWSSQSGGSADGLFRSTDGGATWTQLRGHGLPAGDVGRIGIAVARSHRIYALIESKEGLVWRSDDRGATWTMVSNDTLVDERPFYYTKIFVSPTDPNRVWTTSVHLTVSTDGGAHFSITGHGIHGDHHAMWIAADGRRIIEGNDGGAAFSQDGGETWAWDKALPISQLYHIGYSREVPYSVCAPLQDNGIWCAPSDPLSDGGISSSQWRTVGGGDGTFALFDPRNATYVWQTSGGQNYAGYLTIHNLHTGESVDAGPYLRDQNVIDPKNLRYRFNWETPIAFDPFDPAVAYTAGNVLFTTRDRGAHWTRISPDLTRNVREHEVVSGGITLDGTGAETSDTILTVQPSRAERGEIWIGTDDAVVQLTRDDGKHWKDVTPPGIAPFGRFASIAIPASDPATAYAVYDLHMAGDRTPYLFVTHDYGTHWQSVAHALPADDEARSVFVDPRNPHLLYLGLERSLWASWNDGASWERISANLPPVSIRDIELQPDRNDLLLATHGRGVYVLDDATVLQQLDRARAAGTYLYPARTAFLWEQWRYWGTRMDGAAPPYGAIVSYYLSGPAKKAPTAEIVDANGNVIRRFDTHTEDGKQIPDLSNDAGINRFTWDLTGEPAHVWRFAPEWNDGYDSGAQVVPGTYTVRLHIDGKTYQQTIDVREDPRMHYTLAELRERRARVEMLIESLSQVDDALNVLSTVAQETPLRVEALQKDQRADLAPAVLQLAQRARTIIATISSNPPNDQDNDFLPDVLRERLQTELDTYFDSSAPATAAQRAEDATLLGLTVQRLQTFAAFEADLKAVDGALQTLHLPSLQTATVVPHPTGKDEGDDDRH